MSRKKQLHYATSNGMTPLALGRPGQFGFKNGCLTKPVNSLQEATMYPGYRGLRKLNKLVSQMIQAQSALAHSVLFDWSAVKELTDLGVISTASVYEKDFIKSNDGPSSRPVPEASVCPGQSGMAPASLR